MEFQRSRDKRENKVEREGERGKAKENGLGAASGVARGVYGLDNLGCDRFARTAPCSEGVDKDKRVLSDRLLELIKAGIRATCQQPAYRPTSIKALLSWGTKPILEQRNGSAGSPLNSVDGHFGRTGGEASRGDWRSSQPSSSKGPEGGVGEPGVHRERSEGYCGPAES